MDTSYALIFMWCKPGRLQRHLAFEHVSHLAFQCMFCFIAVAKNYGDKIFGLNPKVFAPIFNNLLFLNRLLVLENSTNEFTVLSKHTSMSIWLKKHK